MRPSCRVQLEATVITLLQAVLLGLESAWRLEKKQFGDNGRKVPRLRVPLVLI